MKILGLDIGVNSVGWSVLIKKDMKYELLKINDKEMIGSLVFPEAMKSDKKGRFTPASERRKYRLPRRQKYRRKKRKYNTLKVMKEFEMTPISKEALTDWKKSNFSFYPNDKLFLDWLSTDDKINKNPYYLRAKFVEKKWDWESNIHLRYELGRVFYHLAQRRGFKSNRLDKSDDYIIENFKKEVLVTLEEAVNTADLISKLQDIYNEYLPLNYTNKELTDTQKTINRFKKSIDKLIREKRKIDEQKQLISYFLKKKENLGKVKGGIYGLTHVLDEKNYTLGQYFWELYQKDRINPENKIRGRYADREKHYEVEFDKICSTQKIPINICKKLKNAIFFQYPLKSQRQLVGKCIFETNKPRIPISRPEYEAFRMWQFINTIKIKKPGENNLRFLNEEERNKILPKFYKIKKTFKFEDIAKELKGNYKVENVEFNYSLDRNVKASYISGKLQKLLGEKYTQVSHYIEYKNKEGKTIKRKPVYFYELAWHALFTFDSEEKLKDYGIKKLRMNDKDAEKYSLISLEQGYGNLSLKAINKILPFLKKGMLYSQAVFMAKIPDIIDKDIWKKNKDEIIEKIQKLYQEVNEEKELIYITNTLIDKVREIKAQYSDIAKDIYKKDVKNALKKHYGKEKWEEKTDEEQKYLQEKVFELFIKQLKQKAARHTEFIAMPKFEERLKDFLIGKNDMGEVYIQNGNLLKKLYHPSQINRFKPVSGIDEFGKNIKLLPLPFIKSIKNPTFNKTMFQLRKLINYLLINGIVDDKTRIHLEMAREVNDENKRKAIENWQKKLEEKRKNAQKRIEEYLKKQNISNYNITADDITKYILWEEQNHKCLYTYEQQTIGIEDFLGNNPKYDIEHTIPRSRFLDNRLVNLTLAERKFNRKVKRRKLPTELDDEVYQKVLALAKEIYENKYKKLEKEINNIKISQIPEAKKINLIKKYELEFERDYFSEKFKTFTRKDIPDSFKSNMLTDTRLIVKVVKEYLGSLFKNKNGNSNIYSVNARAVSEFRKIWMPEVEKTREHHFHHAIDATIVAAINKNQYERFEQIWKQADDDESKKNVIKNEFASTKPWKTFSEDLMELKEKTLITHKYKDNIGKQTKKKQRKRGKIVYKITETLPEEFKHKQEGKDYHKINKHGKTYYKIPIYLQGDTARGALHQQNYIGAIKQPVKNKNGKFIFDENGNIKTSDRPTFVKREPLEVLKKNQSKRSKIIDDIIREIINRDLQKETELNSKIEKLKKANRNTTEEREKEINEQIEYLKQEKNKLYRLPSRKHPEGIPIKKVRIASDIKDPLSIKPVMDVFLSKHKYKQEFYAGNDENYAIVLYESIIKGKLKRQTKIINNKTANEFYRKSEAKYRKNTFLYPLIYKDSGFKYLLKKGTQVLFYQDSSNELKSLCHKELNKRLYIIKALEKDGRLRLALHTETKSIDDLIKETEKESVLEFNGKKAMRLSKSYFNFIVKGIDFEINTDGSISFLY